ncbi:putative chitinase 3 [Caerostris extrusa]|uniref:Chitinase 3 n=1 Tax=Caerostris extrusa TaxID=172846 RepID=A0AAV4MFC1_CAEEX|nr:putative chitinase 3 [Caerostris extrusa]
MICESQCKAKCDPTLDCTTATEPESSLPVNFLFCTKRDFLPHALLCQHYIDCSVILRFTEKCPQGLHFNPTKRVCDFPEMAGCGKPSESLPSPDLYHECSCEACLLPSEYNCLEYFLCLNHTAYRMKCSDGLLFDKKLNTCNLANRVVCDSTTTTAPSTRYTRITTNLPYTTENSMSLPYTNKSTTRKYSNTSKTTTSRPLYYNFYNNQQAIYYKTYNKKFVLKHINNNQQALPDNQQDVHYKVYINQQPVLQP